MGRLEAIWSKRARRGPMDAVDRSVVVAARGLEGNTDQGGRRQVTLIEREIWAQVCQELGTEIPPSARRANLMISGVSLSSSRERILRIGSVRIRILGETRPCERMDEAHLGLREALGTPWRGGAFGEILDSGTIAIGDAVEWVDAPAGEAEPPAADTEVD